MKPRSSQRRGKTPQIMAAGVILALFGSLAVWAWRQSPPVRPPANSRTNPGPETRSKSKSSRRSPETVTESQLTQPDSRKTPRLQERQSSSARTSPSSSRKSQDPFVVSVETTEPGFVVEVDGILARDDNGDVLLTPCEIPLEPGPRQFRLARRGYRDISRQVVIIEKETVSFESAYDPFGEPTGYFASPFHPAPVGQEVDLSAAFPEGTPQTPWLSQDGLDLYFCGESAAGRGVFHAHRSHSDLMFEPALLIHRTSEQAASPSATRDGLQVAYVIPSQRQVRSLIRAETSEAFRSGPPLLFDEESPARWPGAYLTPEGGHLMVFSTDSPPHQFRLARRRGDSAEFAFTGKARQAPAIVPCLSADGSMWYWLAGNKLLKALRNESQNPFENGTELCTLPDDAATDLAQWQGFCLSHDEQWVWFARGVEGKPHLAAMRIQGVPTHGPRLIGRPRDPAIALDKNRPEASPPDAPAAPAMADTPPREIPSYPAFRRRLVDELLTGNIDAAHQLWTEISQQLTDPATAAILAGDAIEVDLARRFWQRLQLSVMTVQPGDKLRLGGSNRTVAQVDPANWSVITRTNSGQERTWGLKDLPVDELVLLADRAEGAGSPQACLESAQMLLWGDATENADFRNRLQRSGDEQAAFRTRWNARELFELRSEATAGNLSRTRRLIEQLVRRAPQSPEAAAAQDELAAFPSRLQWNQRGGQQWQQTSPHVWEPQQARAAGGHLASERNYRNFRLMLDWRTTEATAQGGVFFRYSGSGPLRKNAWKLQLSNDAGLATPDRFSTGALFGIKPPTAHPIRPAGDWNSLELEVKGDRATARINGEPVLDAILSDPNIPASGTVCLDGEFRGISYRKVIIEPLPEDE